MRADLATVEMDLLQYAESYYFRESSPDTSLAAALPYVVDLIDAGERSSAPEVRNAAAMLSVGLGELAALVRREYVGDVGGITQTLAAFAADHRQTRSG